MKKMIFALLICAAANTCHAGKTVIEIKTVPTQPQTRKLLRKTGQLITTAIIVAATAATTYYCAPWILRPIFPTSFVLAKGVIKGIADGTLCYMPIANNILTHLGITNC